MNRKRVVCIRVEVTSLKTGGAASNAVSSQSIQESMRLLLLVRAYQVNGHSMVGGFGYKLLLSCCKYMTRFDPWL